MSTDVFPPQSLPGSQPEHSAKDWSCEAAGPSVDIDWKSAASLCWPIFVMTLIALGVNWFLFQSPYAALVGFMAALFGGGATLFLLRKQSSAAWAVLRNSDLRDSDLAATGIFRPILTELLRLVQSHEAESRRLNELRTRSDARTHLLKNQVRRLEQILDNLDLPVFLFDSVESLIHHNASASSLMAAVAGNTAPTAKDAWKQLDSLKELVSATKSRSTASNHRIAELNLKCQNQVVPYRAQADNLFDDEGRLSGVVAILTDIRDEVQERGKQAEFVSSVSHELKTPLASIRAYTELLMDDDVDDPEERLELLRFIDEQVERLTRLVNNLLNLARVESGVIKVQREDIDINAVLRKAVSVVAAPATEKNITVIDELSDLYLPAHMDADLFGQAAINLLSNAIKYTPVGGEVRLRSRLEETEAVIEVQDNGMGIPSEALPRLFERFYRVPQNNKAAAGTGLGLALVKYIVTNIHDGSISVTSTVNQGSCFTIRVPLGHRDRRARLSDTPVRSQQKSLSTASH